MKARQLDCNGVVVTVTTKEDVELPFDLYGLQSETQPLQALLNDLMDWECDGYGGVVVSTIPGNRHSVWEGLVCKNPAQINRMLTERLSDTPDDIQALMVDCEEPWVVWGSGGATYFALLITVCGAGELTFVWAVSRFEPHEWERWPRSKST